MDGDQERARQCRHYTLSVRPAVFFLSFFFSLLSGVDAGVCWGSAHFESLTFFSFSFFTGKNSIVRPSSFTFFFLFYLFRIIFPVLFFLYFSIPPPPLLCYCVGWVSCWDPVVHTQDASIWDHLFSFFHLVRLHRSRRARRFYAHD